MKTLPALLLLTLMVCALAVALPVKAQEPLNITIKGDGNIEPTNSLLEKNGTTYTFKGDIFGSITARVGGITIDGAGYTLHGNNQDTEQKGINIVGVDATFSSYSNILVKNLRISNFSTGIYTVGSNNNSFIGNYFEHSGMHVIGGGSTANIIQHNTFDGAVIFEDYNIGGLDVITENNFINSSIFVDLAKPPIVDNNFWSNYTAEYPNATEVGTSGVWNTSYQYDRFVGGSHGDYPCLDSHPSVKPILDFPVATFSNLTEAALPTTTSSLKVDLPTNFTLVFWLAGGGVATIIIILLVVLASRKKKINYR